VPPAEAPSRLPLGDRLRRRWRRRVLVPLELRAVAPVRRWRNRRREYRPVFVAGAMGSGTTLLAFSLGQRFERACVIEESALQIAGSSFLHLPDLELYDSIRAYQQATLPRDDWSPERGRADLLQLYRSHGRGGSDVVFDKGPNVHLVRASFLARCFPQASFVAVFRDPVAVIEGFRRKWRRFGNDPLEENLRFYREVHERLLEQAPQLGSRLLVLRYEDLVEHHEAVLERLRATLRLEPVARPPRLAARANVRGQGIRNVRGGRIGVLRDGNEEAYRRLPAETVTRIRAALGDVDARLRALAWTP
jgi:hypothetical protein